MTPGTLQLHEPSGIALVYCPGGTFALGDTESGPIHEVELPPFWIGKYPVTNAEYGRFLEAAGRAEPKYWHDCEHNGPRQSVVGVDWNDATAFCRWAGLRLPTEAQWECACRAGTTTRYWSGDTEADLARVGWYRDNSEGRTRSVGKTPANAWGLHDVHGNVWEWCVDRYSEPSATDPTGPGSDARRVVRGGCWLGSARDASAADRFGAGVTDAKCFIGLRVALPAVVLSA